MISHGLKLALKAIDDNQSELSRICGVSQPTVWGWINKGRGILPAEYVLLVEAATGVSRHDLRPDLYPRDGDTPPFPLVTPGADNAAASAAERERAA